MAAFIPSPPRRPWADKQTGPGRAAFRPIGRSAGPVRAVSPWPVILLLILAVVTSCRGDDDDDPATEVVAAPTSVATAEPTSEPSAPTIETTPTESTSPAVEQTEAEALAPTEVASPTLEPPTLEPTAEATPTAEPTATVPVEPELVEFEVPAGSRPHDVAPAEDGGVWYTAQGSGQLGWLNPDTGDVREIPLGEGSAPHGVIVGPDGAPWITDGGLNAIVRVNPGTDEVSVYPLPAERPSANLNTAVFDASGILWFTGQNGIYGRLDPESGELEVFDAPRGRGPYGITATLDGTVFYASLAGSHVGQINPETGAVTELEPPTPEQGARRVWADSMGRVWVSEWNAGQVAVYDPDTGEWREWRLPGDTPQPYAVYVDERDVVWLSDFGSNALVRFDPATEAFQSFPTESQPGDIRQIHGRPGEVWGALSANDRLVVLRYS